MLPQRLLQVLPAIGAFLLTLICGYLVGRIVTGTVMTSHPPLTMRQTSGALVPTVAIVGIVNGEMRGTMKGNARFIVGNHIVIPDGSGAFRIAMQPLQKTLAAVPAPPGARFVASKRGKKYYPVNDPSAGKLSPANTIYFSSAAEAEKAGYRK